MYSISKTRVFVLIVCLIIGANQAAQASYNGNEGRSISKVKQDLSVAISNRNFHDAMERLEELCPLIKKEIKKSKKELTALQKAENPDQSPESYRADLIRKEEIYESLKKHSAATSAAFRVKAEIILELVDELHELVTET